MQHILESQQFDRPTLEKLFISADKMQTSKDLPLRGKIMSSLFYEPSTRTRFSFESAMLRLGGQVISTENGSEFSSASKGETLTDSIRVISNYADVIVLRHSATNASHIAASVATIPVINAGDGTGQHPTQALLDLYTIRAERGKIDGTHIAFVGDLKNGRTVRSLTYLLTKYKNIKISFISPEGLKIGDDIKEYLDKQGVDYEELTSWDTVLEVVDVIYQTRIQKERFSSQKEYEKFKGCYIFTAREAKMMKKGAIIMHPLPRVDEIDVEVDDLPQAAYFKQVKYGVFVRMALLHMVLKGKKTESKTAKKSKSIIKRVTGSKKKVATKK